MTVSQQEALEALKELGRKTPKKANLVVFVGRVDGAFIDNTKYAFLDCVRHFPQLTCFFLTHNHDHGKLLAKNNLPVLVFPTPQAMQLCARAATVVCDDFWWRSQSMVHLLFQRARIFQLWHGIPLKKIGFPEIESTVNMTPEKAAYLRANYSGYDAVLSTSPWFTSNAFAPSFGAKDFPELGYPRNDAMLRNLDKNDFINVDVQLYSKLNKLRKDGWKVIFYMPTFRDVGGDPFSDRLLPPNRLFPFLEREKAVLVCKFHPYVDIPLSSNSPNLLFCNSQYDIYPLLRLADVLVTDYSSVYFDFLLLDRPMLFYLYDHENYISRNRELNFPLEDFTPGPRAYDEESFYEELGALLAGKDRHIEERRALLDKSFTHHDGKSGVRVNEYVLNSFVAAKQGAVS